MTGAGPPRTLVIGVGNEFRCDDGLGIVLARRIEAKGLPGVKVIEASGEGAALMDAWQGAGRVILIDAVRPSGTVGTLHRIDAHQGEVPSDFFHYSTHAFSVAESVELARALDLLPPALVIYGVEGADYSMGQTLSNGVVEVMDEVEAKLVTEIEGATDA